MRGNRKSIAIFLRLFLAARKVVLSEQLRVASSVLLVAVFASAQENPGNAQSVQPDAESNKAPAKQSPPTVNEDHQRMFLVIPAFSITNQQHAAAYTPKQKWALAARQTFDPFMWASTGIEAGMSQASNEFPAYGQGTLGYSNRYGAALLDNLSGEFSGTAICVLLKQDPRYFRLGHGSIRKRVLYALAQQVSAKSDSGTRMVNWSNLVGTFASSALSNAYYPRVNRGFGLSMNRATVGFLWSFPGELQNEFGPDVSHRFFHKRREISPEVSPSSSPQTPASKTPHEPSYLDSAQDGK